MGEPNGRTLQTVQTALELVETIREMGGASLPELTERLDLPKSTLYYHLSTLQEEGYVVKRDGQYDLGLKFFSLGSYSKRQRGDYDVVERALRDIAQEMTVVTDFAVEENGHMVVVTQRIGQATRSAFIGGAYFPMTCTSAGKAILAEFSEERVEEILDEWGLPAATDNSITDREELREDLRRTRTRGYSVSDEEAMDGLRSTSAAVARPDGEILGAISISGPTYRFSMEELHGRVSSRLLRAVDRIESDLREQAAARTPTNRDDGGPS